MISIFATGLAGKERPCSDFANCVKQGSGREVLLVNFSLRALESPTDSGTQSLGVSPLFCLGKLNLAKEKCILEISCCQGGRLVGSGQRQGR